LIAGYHLAFTIGAALVLAAIGLGVVLLPRGRQLQPDGVGVHPAPAEPDREFALLEEAA